MIENLADVVSVVTPEEIDLDVRYFCQRVKAGSKPAYIPLAAKEGCRPDDSVGNVARLISAHGGETVSGWVVTRSVLMLEAEPCVAWRTPNRHVKDVTPKSDGRVRSLFVADPDLVVGPGVDNVRQSLLDLPVIDEIIANAESQFRARQGHRRRFGGAGLPSMTMLRLQGEAARLYNSAAREVADIETGKRRRRWY